MRAQQHLAYSSPEAFCNLPKKPRHNRKLSGFRSSVCITSFGCNRKSKRYKLSTALFQFRKGTKPAFYAIIAVALIIFVCGCTGQSNTTIQATNAPSELPNSIYCDWLKRRATNTPLSATPTTAPRSAATPTPSAPLTVGTSFPCIH